MTDEKLYGKAYEKTIEKIKSYAKKHIKPSRYEHSERVAQMCVELCRKYGLDEKKGYLAGISHDICKSFNDKKMIKYASMDNQPITDFEMKKVALLHGRAGAVILKKRFKIEDEQILEAVANHTSGLIGMNDITKVLFIADKIEPGRPQSTDEYRAKLLAHTLNGMISEVLTENYEYVISKGFEVYPQTKKMVEYYRELASEE